MGHERVEFDERFWIEQQPQAFARGQLAPRVLLIDALVAAAFLRFRAQRQQSLSFGS